MFENDTLQNLYLEMSSLRSNIDEEIQSLLINPSVSDFLKNALKSINDRNLVQIRNEIRLLSRIVETKYLQSVNG